MELVKTVPPPRRGGRIDWEEVATRLMQQPGEWGRIDDVSRSTASQIRLGRVAALRPPTDWEAVIRHTDEDLPPNRCSLFLRYRGAR